MNFSPSFSWPHRLFINTIVSILPLVITLGLCASIASPSTHAQTDVPHFSGQLYSAESEQTNSVAWGDYDGDGNLDLAIGNRCSSALSDCRSARLYRNDNGNLTTSPVWSSTESNYTLSVAWGDVDNDGYLDLAVGNDCRSSDPDCRSVQLYHNNEGVLTSSAVWSSAEATNTTNTTSVAWGDYDGDGNLDLAVANGVQPIQLYRNSGGSLTPSIVLTSTVASNATSLAWGDYDSDGALDLVMVGDQRTGQGIQLYRNVGNTGENWTFEIGCNLV